MMKFFRKNNKIIFLILTPLLAVGLVLSFTIWSSPSISNSARSNRQVNQGPPIQQDNEVVKMLTDIRRYEQVLKSSPENYTVLLDLGNTSYDLGSKYMFELQQVENGVKYFAKATGAYKRALEVGEPDPNIMTDLATAAMYSGQNDMAEDYFNKAIEADAEHIFAKMNYGVFLMNVKQDYAKAVEQWQEVLELKPDAGVKSRVESMIREAQAQLANNNSGGK